MIWLKIGLPLLLIIAVALAVKSAVNRYSDTMEELGQAQAKLAICQTANATQDAANKALTERIKAINARMLEQVQREEARVAEAKAEAERIKAQRDKAKADLAIARRDWQEAMNNDPVLANFSRIDVPGAVFVRLRDAAGQ